MIETCLLLLMLSPGGLKIVYRDQDSDGNPDSEDLCPANAEDKDGFEDSDGCPDMDNDRDDVLDSEDLCPSTPGLKGPPYKGCPGSEPDTRLQNPAPDTVAPQKPRPQAVVPDKPALPPLPSVDGRLPTGKRAPLDSAVVVGLQDYLLIPDVPGARRDAEAFYNLLLYTRGVPAHRIRLLTSGSNEHIRQAVKEAGAEVGPGGMVWFYFAGHGAASPTTRERLLLGDDVRADAVGFESRAVSVAELEQLASARGARATFVLDTCYAGVGRDGQSLMNTRFLVPAYETRAAGGVAEWNATGPSQLSGPLPGTDHGAFSYFVLGALRGWADGELDGQRDGRVTGEEANAYVGRALRAGQIRDQQPVWVGAEGGRDWILSEGAGELGPAF